MMSISATLGIFMFVSDVFCSVATRLNNILILTLNQGVAS